MKVVSYQNGTDFLAATGALLQSDEARYGLILGMAKGAEVFPERFSDAWFCSVATETDINAVIMRTPPRSILMAHFSGSMEMISEQFAAAVTSKYGTIPGVVGDKELADVFATLWCKKRGTKITHTMAQKIHRLDKVNDVPLSSGKMRAATVADKDLLEKWFHAFRVDVSGEETNEPEVEFMPAVELGWVFLWEDGKPVSMATKSRPTEKGMNVFGVYTPPELRGRGYATSCVAELSRNILQSGKEFCVLYTDLANPTSNSIYKKIGYKEVADSVAHTFAVPE